jgi:hypothetical protein
MKARPATAAAPKYGTAVAIAKLSSVSVSVVEAAALPAAEVIDFATEVVRGALSSSPV